MVVVGEGEPDVEDALELELDAEELELDVAAELDVLLSEAVLSIDTAVLSVLDGAPDDCPLIGVNVIGGDGSVMLLPLERLLGEPEVPTDGSPGE